MSKEVLSDLSVKGTLSIPKTGGGEMNVQQEIEGKQATLSFDSTPTASSTNPVTSGGVYTALDAKQDKLTFDNTPTAGSTNPVKSGGIYSAFDVKVDKDTYNHDLGDIIDAIVALSDNLENEYVDKLKARLLPVMDCTDLLTLYKGDLTLTETPVINATGCTSLKEVFRGCTNLKTVKYIHTPNVTNMYRMFYECSSLTSIPELDVSNVTDMSYMFSGCSSLTSTPTLDVSNVTKMASMFSNCSSLTSTSEIDVSSVTTMTNMFFNCSLLTSVMLTGNVVPPYNNTMFYGTPIASGNGYIFVPDELVQAYKTASGWSTHASVIFGHSDKESMTSQVQQMAVMNIENKPSDEELQLMMLESDDAEHRDNERC